MFCRFRATHVYYVQSFFSLTAFRFRCMKRCVQLEDDAVLSAQCQRFATLSLRDIGLQKNLQSSSEQPFLASIRLLQVRLRSLSRHPTTTCSTSSLPHPVTRLLLPQADVSQSVRQSIVSMTSPFGKRQLILECSRSMAQELESIAKSASAGVVDSVSYITADEFIAVFNYVLIRASAPCAVGHNLHPCSMLVCVQMYPRWPPNSTTRDSFRPKMTCLASQGAVPDTSCVFMTFVTPCPNSYYLSTLEASTSWLKNLSEQALAVDAQ